MNYSHRFFLYGPVGLFTALLLATMGYWWFASDAFSKHLDALNNRDVAPGVHFSFAKKTIAGFPFRLDAELDGLRIEIATSHGPTVWTAERFATHSLMYGSPQFVFEAAGQQHIVWHDDAGRAHAYDFLPGTLRASAIVRNGGISRFDLDLIEADSPDVSAARLQIHLRKDPKIDGLDFFVSADAVHIAPDLEPAFGPDIRHIALDATISPGSSFDGVLAGHADWRKAAADWHERHGGLLVNRMELDWGKFNATGKGALAVDEMHRPLGAVRLKIASPRKLMSPGSPQAHSGLAAGLAAFAAQQNSSADDLDTAVTLKDGVLYIGTIPADLLSPLF